MTFQHSLDLLTLTLITSFCLTILLGWGSLGCDSLVNQRLGIASKKQLRLGDFWIGLLGIISFAETCNFWLPEIWHWKMHLALNLPYKLINLPRGNH